MPTFDITDSSQDADLFGDSPSSAPVSAKPFNLTDDSMDAELFGHKYDTKPTPVPEKSLLDKVKELVLPRDRSTVLNHVSGEQITNDKGSMSGAVGMGTKEDPFVSIGAPADIIYNHAPIGSYVKMDDGTVQQRDASLGDKIVGGLHRVFNDSHATAIMADAQHDAESIQPNYAMAGKLPISSEVVAPTRAQQIAATDRYFAADIAREEANAKEPLSIERQLLDKELSKPQGFLAAMEVLGHHKGAALEKLGEQLLPYAPLSFLGPVAPVAGAGMMGLQEKADGMKRYLASKGIDYHDKAARDAFLADPTHRDEAESYGDIHAAAMMGAVAASAGLAKAANVGLDAAKVAGTARTVASVPVHIAANAVPFEVATRAANAATGDETTGAESAQNLAMAVGFGAHGAVHEHIARTVADKARANDITNATLENYVLHKGAADKADTNTTLDIKAELERKAQEKAKDDAFAQAEQDRQKQDQQAADEKEAGFRTIALEDKFKGASRVERAGDSLVERVPVNPPAEVSPEQVKAEREQAQKDEADRLDRVELGGLTEQLRKRQDQHAKKQGVEDIKLQKGQQASEARRRRGIMDELITANPGVPAADLAPLYRERLKGASATESPNEGVTQEATQTPTEGPTFATNGAAQAYRRANKLNESHTVTPLADGKYAVTPREVVKEPLTANVSKDDNQLSDAEVRELSRAAGLYEPEPTAAGLNMAGAKKGGPKPDFAENVHGIVKKLVGMSGTASQGVQHLLLQKKLVLAPNAESIGRTDTGVGAYDRETGKMYLYTDHLKPGDAAGAIIASLHESTHLGQFNDRAGRSSILQQMMSKDRENAASTKIRAAAEAGNTIAKAAVRKALAAHPDSRVQDLELTPYFVGEVAKHRQGTLGRVGGVANDILSAGRSFVKDKLGVDLNLTMGDLHTAAMHTASEAAATHVSPDGKGTFDMIAGRHAAGIHKAEQEGRVYKGHVDHMDRFEIPDEHAELANPTHPEEKHVYERLINRETVPLHDVLKHSELYANYPELKDVQVKMADLSDASGSYDMRRNIINMDRNTMLNALSSPKSHEDLRNLFLHETQHAVQNIEGFVPGNSAKYFIPKSLTRQYVDAKARMDNLVDGFELGRALKSMDFESGKQWNELMKWARPTTLKETAALFLANDFGVHSSDRAIARYNEQYREAARNYKEINDEHEKARVKAYRTYLRDYGETEARNTEFRSRMNAKERAAMMPEETMEFASGGVPVGRTLDTVQYAGGRGVPESSHEGLPATLSMAAESEPLNDKTTTPRKVGETERQWQERIAKENVAPLTKAVTHLFGTDVSREQGRQIQVGWMAKRDRQFTTAERSIARYKVYFDKLTEDQRLSLIDDWENGRTISDPDALEMFKAINPLMKGAIDTIRQHDPEVLKKLREFYLPHVWKKPARATAFFQTRGPLGGDKAFTKAKKWPTMKQAIDEGHLEPVTTNPAELAMLKMGELLKYASLLEARHELVSKGLAIKTGDKDLVPDGYTNVRDASFNGYLVHEAVAKDLNNYLSRGLSDVPGFKKVRYIENMMVAGKLGWSGFHAAFTTMDNMGTGLDVALRSAVDMDINGALLHVVKAFASPVQSPYAGGAYNKLYLGEQPKSVAQAAHWSSPFGAGVDEHTMALLDLIEKGGGRAYMDPSEWNAGLPKLMQGLRQKKLGQTLKSTIPAYADASGWLIHRKLVPAQKAAARVLLLKFELDRFAKHYDLGVDVGDYTGIINAMHPDAAAQVARKVVNLVDDRLGHMSYDNQFWNPYAKHMAQLVVMAPGWAIGTWRTISGGLTDTVRLVSPEKILGPLDRAGTIHDATFGRLTSRTSNLIVMSLMTAAASGLFMYALTGQWPTTVKDYTHPKTGRKNADGTDERISWPNYAKEHYALLTHPVKEVAGKLNQPLIQDTWELLHNADFTNTEIYDSKGPLSTQLKEIAAYIVQGFYQPISASNASRADKMDELNPDTPDKNNALRVAAMFGMTPAKAEVDHSDAENFINEKYFDTFPKGALSREKRDELSGKSEMANLIRAGGKPDLSAYSPKERRAIEANAQIEVYSKRLKKLASIEDRVQAWDLATPAEREKYDMRKIVLNNARELISKIKDPDLKATMQQRINEIRDSQ